MFLTIITFLIVLSVLVFVHELGHFVVARKFGVKAEEFGFGFPPRIWGIYKDDKGKWKQVWGMREVKDSPSTVFSINWIPIGGFVKLKGEDGGDKDKDDSFANKSISKRAAIISAGVTMNIVLAAVIFSIGLMMGMIQTVDNLDDGVQVRDRKIQIVQVLDGLPAAAAGLQMGDAIVSINNNSFTSYSEVQQFVDGHIGQQLEYRIKRGQDEFISQITPQIIKETNKGGIGIAIAETGIVRYPWYLAIGQGIKTTLILTWVIIVAFYELIKGLIMGQGVSVDLAGPVGIAALTGQMARMGVVYIMQFTALLSINLAIINFFPFPALDGGRILFLMIEKIKGSPVRREIEAAIHNLGFALLMLLVLVVTFRDVAKFGDKFKMLWERIIG